ncbi:MAG: glycosyltransferase family 2 protein [Ignavibacteria bacterium]|nr:glycosyltransferase family 2 protein [Ignavibacteria bacterium]MBK7576663.1 glycosyltransferase family 2 protein [Ignavibacteria bacterium]MBK9181717.1 glycosyltransferase family 2 protein [Ignavibacteria bacterium]
MSEEQQGHRPSRRRRPRRRPDGTSPDVHRVEGQRQEQPRQEQPRQEQPRQEQPRQEQPRHEQPRQEHPRQDHPRPDFQRRDQSRHQHSRGDRRPPVEQLGSSSVSVVVPLLNEAESLPELAKQLESVLERVARGRYEVLFIDDGSTDDSFGVIQDLHTRNNRFKAIRFRTNHGKSAALAIGFAESKGDIVITMDADLQDDPAEIPALISKLDEGFDLVSGWKRKRHDPWHKTIPSKLFNSVTSRMSGIKLHDFNCGLKAYRRDVVNSVQVYGEMHRYIPALAHWEGFRVTEIPVQHRARQFGSSKFGMSRFLKGYLDLLTVMFTTRYIKRPLHFFGAVGSLFAIVGLITDLYLVVEWFLGHTSLSNRPLALFGVAMIIVGVQLISIGLIGELIVKNNLEHQRFSVRERLT